MKAQLSIVLLGLSMCLAAPAWSQIGVLDVPDSAPVYPSPQSSDSSQQSPDLSQSSSSGPQPAYTHPEQLPPLGLLGEVTAETGLRLGLSTGMFYDTSGGFSATARPSTYYFLTPSLSMSQIRPTLSWTFTYSGGLSLSSYSGSHAANSNYGEFAQAGVADVLYQLTSRWQIHAHDSYTYSNDPFTPYLTYTHDPTPNQPNPTIYTPQAIGQSNRGLLEVSHYLTAHDVLTFSGSENFFRVGNTTYSGYNSFSYGGRAAYNHIFSAKFSAGGGYNFNALDFAHGQSRSGVSMILGFATYQFSPNLSLSGWVGPEYTTTKDIVPQFCFMNQCFGYTTAHQQAWTVAYGTTFGWTGQRNALRAEFSKQVSDGGGLLGTVRLYLVDANYTRRLNGRTQVTAGMLYGNNLSASLYYSDRYIDSIVTTVTVKREFNRSWTGSLTYGYLNESQKNIYPYPTWKANRFGFRLQYLWGHSLGR
jgi:hypothetical protein